MTDNTFEQAKEEANQESNLTPTQLWELKLMREDILRLRTEQQQMWQKIKHLEGRQNYHFEEIDAHKEPIRKEKK